jgi:peptide/nickel transport system permease protein
MLAYLVRRIAWGVATVLGVLLFLFMLFFLLATPDDIARKALGEKAPQAALDTWKQNHGYDKPRVWNPDAPADTMLADHFRRMLTFDFGNSDADDTPISARLKSGAGPSLAFTVPLFVLGLALGIALSLFVAFFRDTYIDRAGTVLAVLAMSVSILLYIIGVQFVLGKLLRWFPISGFDPSPDVIVRFLALPIVVGLVSGVGADLRFYRTVFVEETSKDYVRTARAKGCGEGRIMARHVLRNSLIPILTGVVMQIPFLFTGSLLLESFFGIPGLGSITVDAIGANDFSTLRVIVFIDSLLFITGQIATDISYTLADPRVRLG